MALNNRERIGKAIDLLAEGLYDLVDEVMTGYKGENWNEVWAQEDAYRYGIVKSHSKDDPQTLLKAIQIFGKQFKDHLNRVQQGFATELVDVRNKWAHGERFSSDETRRALDTAKLLLQAVNATESAETVHKMIEDLQRTVYEKQTQDQKKQARFSSDVTTGLPAWRTLIRPHDDVARGNFTAAEFAANLHSVHTGESLSAEYSDPVEFFNRTYLTEGLRDLLSRALQRLNGSMNASPVINLQTNFGGGKTHSMLALYHLFSGIPADDLPEEIGELVSENGSPDLSTLGVRRVALVGTYLKAGAPSIKEDGTAVNTIWGELAWQLGGREAYDIIASSDKSRMSPGEDLKTLLKRYAPALILIDEWVAYARDLVGNDDACGGTFDTQFTFAQLLTETVAEIPGAMVVISIPASDSDGSGGSNDLEVGGNNGRKALERLQNVTRRVANQWRPSSKDESFEIVRRRLFQTPDADAMRTISTIARTFVDLYRNNTSLFPSSAATPNSDYEARIKASYPLHPELLDRFYEDWSTLERFQRTRGVLKLMSAIVHELWASNDQSPLIMPATVPLAATSVSTDLTQYLEDSWKAIIDSDVDGPTSTPYSLDATRPHLGHRSIAKRIARTIFIGSAPRSGSARKGLDKQYVWLGTALPGDTLADFGGALELLAQNSTYFYADQGMYWFDTKPSLMKTAREHADRLREDPGVVWNEITQRLQNAERPNSVFGRVHIAPQSSADVPDTDEVRLVIVPPKFGTSKKAGSQSGAQEWVRDFVENKGSAPRTHRNSLIFVASGTSELETLEGATRNYLAWKMIIEREKSLNLTSQQLEDAKSQLKQYGQSITDNIRNTFIWALYPTQPDPQDAFIIDQMRIPDSGGHTITDRVSTAMCNQEEIITILGPEMLGQILHEQLGALWTTQEEISVKSLWDIFTKYPYMPRLSTRQVLDQAILGAADRVLMSGEQFAIAGGKSPDTKRYTSLIIPPDANAQIQVSDNTLLVDYVRAQQQHLEDEKRLQEQGSQQSTVEISGHAQSSGNELTGFSADDDYLGRASTTLGTASGPIGITPMPIPVEQPKTRFFGTASIDGTRFARSAVSISQEIIDILIRFGDSVTVKIDIDATKSDGFSQHEMRTIKENATTLKFEFSEFEEE
ncbi:DUF499 domain-containing protein [Schaalia sp. ZJ405]|uniref:DUF499 domain-containing protein n=1 Tax=Schaalia sp. ZJ405 TaxID=2709403 RepID=UPI0013EB5BDF|nr:DUF499 domain-containing protein [Schaalia sp. ZJ405]QPK81226.1 DUF499 domain-containing protein [Schaalia sp. ZJ405]